MKLPDTTKIKNLDLRIRSLDTALKFYSEMLGFRVIHSDGKSAYLSANGNEPYIIGLHEDVMAAPRLKGTPGLYHVAFLFRRRKELADVFMRLFNANTKFHGFSDHLVSEAIYLSDPDGNGIELYVDKPQSEWTWEMAQVMMDSLPLDLRNITKEYDPDKQWNGIHHDTRIGHIHLNVSDLHAAEKVYGNMIGMNVTNSLYPGAMFFAAGKYHHHVGTNIWSAKRTTKQDHNSLGLMSYTISVPDHESIKEIEDKAAAKDLILEKFDGKNMVMKDLDGTVVAISHE